ncbi:MAG: hypothetical protein JWO48_3569, partial [Bryobacterales bacterium]|nr:hypothetical protein [Bryobacterales bacterium]
GAVNAVALNALREKLADGALGGIRGICRSHDFAQLRDGVFALECHHDNGTFRHKLYKAGKERSFAVYRVETFGLRLIQARHPQRENLEAFFFDDRKDVAGMALGHGVRFDNGKRSLDHKRLLTFSPISAGDEQTVIPARSSALIFSDAVPEPPEMIAPA